MARRTTRTAVAAGALTALTAAALALPATAGAAGSRSVDANTDGTRAAADVDTGSALVVLRGEPLATAPGTRAANGRVDSTSTRTKNARAALAAERNAFRKWLQSNAPKAKVTNEFDTALHAVGVQLGGTPLSVLRQYSGTVEAQHQPLYTPTATDTSGDPDLPLVKAFEAWAKAGGAAEAGKGVKVAVVDSGIDTSHPCFSDGPVTGLTNDKVTVAKVFYNKADNRRLTPAAVDSHGTHVAGTIACDAGTPATVDGVEVPYGISGVAPAATLGNYNVFPGDVASARSEDIVDALEEAYADGFDVANMSLGGDTHGAKDLLANAVDNLTAAGMVVVISAGNEGPGDYTIGSPGSAAGAITVGASSVPHFVGSSLTVGEASYPAAKGSFGDVPAGGLTAPLAVVPGPVGGLDLGCGPISGVEGALAVVSRGSCTFTTKVRNAQDAGAVGVVVVNAVAGDPTAMPHDDTDPKPTIPAVMVGLGDRAAVVAADEQDGTVAGALTYQLTANENVLAGFSSVGPVDVTQRVKPDLVAPGVNVLSSFPAGHCAAPPCFSFLNGTSMSAPHVAGAAAVLLGEGTAPEHVKGALVATADRDVLTRSDDASAQETRVQAEGAGLMDVAAALDAPLVLGPVSTTFGKVPAGSGQTRSASVTVTNVSGETVTFTPRVDDPAGDGATFTTATAPVTLAPGASTSLPVSVTVDRGADSGGAQALLLLTDGGVELAHGALFVLVS